MFRVSILLLIVPATLCIIVRDPKPSPSDYKYSYNIDDPTTGDSKSQHEVRIGDVVSGAYSVVGPDGTKRTVEYTADAKNGFKAVLREDPVSPPALKNPAYVSSGPATNYITDNSAVYFTPGNDIKNESPFAAGQFFIPATN